MWNVLHADIVSLKLLPVWAAYFILEKSHVIKWAMKLRHPTGQQDNQQCLETCENKCSEEKKKPVALQHFSLHFKCHGHERVGSTLMQLYD